MRFKPGGFGESCPEKATSIDFQFNKLALTGLDRLRKKGSRERQLSALFVSVERGQVSLAFMGTPPTIEFASLGMADSLILMVMALVVFGPRRLPQIGRQVGKLMYEFRKASNDFKFQMEEELRVAEEADRRKQEEARQRTLALNAPVQESVSAPPPATVNAIESPYPGEGQYPSLTASEEARAEESAPRILPPSTGETVAATPPARPAEFIQPATESGAASASDSTDRSAAESVPKIETPVEQANSKEQSAAAAEAVSHNG